MISIIVAIAKKGVIGINGNIPWHLPEDLGNFARITKRHTVIMGRVTYESIISRLGRPLRDRNNVVITSQHGFLAPGCTVIKSVADAIDLFTSVKEEVFVIGGSKIYSQFLPIADKLYITEIDKHFHGDTFFPEYNKEEWKVLTKEHHPPYGKRAYAFDYFELTRR